MSTLAPLLLSLLSVAPVSLQFDGTLKDAIRAIAEEGGLNVLVEGQLDQEVQIDLSGLPADEALASLATAYQLEVQREGRVWVVRRRAPLAAEYGAMMADASAVARDGQVELPAIPPEAASVLKELARGIRSVREGAESSRADASAVVADATREVKLGLRSVLDEAEAARDELQAARDEVFEARTRAKELAREQRENARALKDAAKARAKALSTGARNAVAGGPVVVKAGTVAQNATAFGGPVVVEAGAVVKSATAFGGPVLVQSRAIVEGDAVSFGGDVVLSDGAIVEGDVVSFGGQVVREGASQIEGEEVALGTGAPFLRSSRDRERDSFGVADFLALFAVFFGLGFLLMVVAPQRLRQIENAVREAPVRSGLVGLVTLIAAVPATVLLAVTVVGIPVAVVFWLCVPLAVLVGVPAIANVVGGALPTGRLRKTQAVVLAAGLLILLLLASVPVLGPAVMVLGTLVGIGALVRSRFGRPPRGVPVPDFSSTASP